MKGGPSKTRKRKRKTTAVNATSNTVSSADTEELNAMLSSDVSIIHLSSDCSSPSTPQRCTRRTGLRQDFSWTSSPVQSSLTDSLTSISKSPTGAKQAELEYTEASDADSQRCKSKSIRKRRRRSDSQPRQLRTRGQKEQKQTSSKTREPQIKCQNERQTLQGDTTQRSRPRFELKPDAAEEDELLLSSDLSIQLSPYEERLPSWSFQEEPETEEEPEEDLPSFLMEMNKKPPSITEGAFVWHKIRNYPFWPALVKSMKRKHRKASVIFIDDLMIHQKKGFSVGLKTLKPFDCKEADELVCRAKEKYDAAIKWSIDLIKDYTIRIACGSFSGSFIEYFAHDISYPVRRMYPQESSERLTISSDSMLVDSCDDDALDDDSSEQLENVTCCSKRLLPDRTQSVHNRATLKLVDFIVKQHKVEERLLAVLRGQQQSRWLRFFLGSNRRRVVNTYLEDEDQLDQVYWYLNDLYAMEIASTHCLAEVVFTDRVPFVLDVLLPEAIIYAIAGVDNVSVKKAEEKYLKGRCLSNRERQELDEMIVRQMRKRHQKTTFSFSPETLS
ncbi:PWWP domain-containing DNA repair factor 3A-like [Solea solea]|uniref:PWWP domain-containing DNA repair factor 3A-like n=1 Tax=Solea solea TaxID=90069 RepID=UPI00272D0B1E|nr:PWWP domain-containing DNA repair factor 3A-like [Solea solea]XP_058486239.1 PWWP domain-containing DNA repair factor 3A-like [Solea solea]